MKISKCKSCDAPIAWTKTQTGKNMPVNADAKGVAVMPHVSHFATCGQADSWRKPKDSASEEEQLGTMTSARHIIKDKEGRAKEPKECLRELCMAHVEALTGIRRVGVSRLVIELNDILAKECAV